MPQFETVVIDDITDHALLTQRLRARTPDSMSDAVWAVADSGASHILIRERDVHILSDLQYNLVSSPPLAVLKTANGAPLSAIGSGILTVGCFSMTAYVFRDRELVNNLLGLAPFADRACTSTFRPSQFQIYPHKSTTPILTGTQDSSQSLWHVNLSANSAPTYLSDGIPPPTPWSAMHTMAQTPLAGIYIESNHVAQQDNASYVSFIHA